MLDLRYFSADKMSAAEKRRRVLEKLACFSLIMLLALSPVGCLVSNDDYEEASRELNQYNERLKTLYLENDRLNLEISRLYNECDLFSSQLSLMAAMNLHDHYTEGLRRPQQPVISTTPKPGNAPKPPTQTTKPSRPKVNTGGTTTPRGGGSSGGTSRPPASPAPAPAPNPVPPPPPRGGGGGGGSIDWGF